MINTRAAIYCRISSDRRGDAAGVARQRADLVKLCEARGWEWSPQLVYEDNNRSAFGSKERPAWKRMLADAADGRFDILVAWHDDRLWRDVTEQQAVFALLAECGVKRISTPGRDYDTASGDDLFSSGVMALVAQKSSLDKRRRLVRKKEEMAAQGSITAASARSATRLIARRSSSTRPTSSAMPPSGSWRASRRRRSHGSGTPPGTGP